MSTCLLRWYVQHSVWPSIVANPASQTRSDRSGSRQDFRQAGYPPARWEVRVAELARVWFKRNRTLASPAAVAKPRKLTPNHTTKSQQIDQQKVFHRSRRGRIRSESGTFGHRRIAVVRAGRLRGRAFYASFPVTLRHDPLVDRVSARTSGRFQEAILLARWFGHTRSRPASHAAPAARKRHP